MIFSTDQYHDEEALNVCAEKLADIMAEHLMTLPKDERRKRMEAAEARLQDYLTDF